MSGSKFLSTLKKAAQVAGDVLTTKGDILSRSASALGRLGIGSNGQVLQADSSETLGIKWATPSGSPTTTKGDLSGFSNVQSRIPISTNGYVLTADSAEALGLKWAATAAGYSAPTLGGTTINSGATVSELSSLSLTSSNNIAWNVTTSGVDIDFSEPDIQTISIAATTTFTTTNRAKGKTKTLRIITDGVTRTMNFPADWKWIGVKPTEQPLDSTGLVKLINYGTTNAFIVASYQVENGGETPLWKIIAFG